MDYGYSPVRECGTLHFPSPTHPHSYRLDGSHFSHLQQLRRSLSRSPSKPSRFQLRNADSPRSPISPLALARAFSPQQRKPTSPTAVYPDSPLGVSVVPAKKKFTLRRSQQPFRASPRTRSSHSKSPRRRVLGESADTANTGSTTPALPRSTFGQENTPAPAPVPVSMSAPARRLSAESPDRMDTDRRLGVNDKPIKFEFARRPDLSPAPPAKSSPLKRNDGSMNLSGSSGSSPMAKRRSLHSVSNLGNDFESIFDQSSNARAVMDDAPRQYSDYMAGFAFSSPISNTHSPVRRNSALRKSTLSQRASNTPRAKPTHDGEFVLPGAAASKTQARTRMSLDGFVSFTPSATPAQTPFRKVTFDAGRMGLPQARSNVGASQPHPLSHAHTPSSVHTSDSDIRTGGPMAPPRAPAWNVPACGPPPTPTAATSVFSRSLPIGIGRPHASDSDQSTQESFDTPFKAVQPPPAAFSTGLLSKKNRNVNEPAGTGIYVMPDTPSKRQSFPPAAADRTINLDTPLVKRSGSLFGEAARPQHQFGTPSTPFSANVTKFNTESFSNRPSMFTGLTSSHQRRGSFVSIDGDDDVQPDNLSPTANRMTDSQSSVDDMPPTPTKPSGGSSRRSKESSLRRKTFRSRPSISNDTFAVPPHNDGGPTTSGSLFGPSSPQTPNESFGPPDASQLSISGHHRQALSFGESFGSSFGPATPTTPRDSSGFFSSVQGAIPIGLTKNDVDEALSSRFQEIKPLDGGEGEFSTVYRVSKPVKSSPGRSPAGSQVWVVKKSKKPYTGSGDRQRKLREVEILYALQGNEHVMGIKAHWEFDAHLYIQTEYCEGGNLRRYLDNVGFNSRLDDFRIWKILLELLLGLKFIHESGYIHLDLKPANILIDFEGGLKIADFGLASQWPAPKHIDGEGDRHYLAPEALSGQFDKPADVFALGMMLAEIAGNCVIPENGVYWQKLRSGEFEHVLPSLTWSAESSTLTRDSHGEPITEDSRPSLDTFLMSDAEEDSMASISIKQALNPMEELARAPRFMVERNDPSSMDNVVRAMLNQDPALRPTADQILACFGCQWVDLRRRSGATVYEGNFGPSDEVLATYTKGQDHVHIDDMMDMS